MSLALCSWNVNTVSRILWWKFLERVNFVRNTHCLSKELRPVTRSSSASSLMSLETRSSTNWSSFVCLDDPVDEVVEDELELGSEPVIMAVDVVGKLKLSPSVNFRHLFSIFAKLDLEKRGDEKNSLLNVEMSPMIDMKSDVDFLHNCRALELSCLSVQCKIELLLAALLL